MRKSPPIPPSQVPAGNRLGRERGFKGLGSAGPANRGRRLTPEEIERRQREITLAKITDRLKNRPK